VAVTALLDALDGRDDLDLDRVGAIGVSMGGYLAPRAAAFEPRVRALVAVSGAYKRVQIYDQLPAVNKETFAFKTRSPSIEAAREVALKMDLEGVLDDFDRPALFMTGDRDRLVPWQQTEMQAKATPGAEWVLVPGGTHVLSNYPYLLRPMVSDWLGDRLNARAGRPFAEEPA
jgi:pimeloyl-ACP methyl ester carboxylesterase